MRSISISPLLIFLISFRKFDLSRCSYLETDRLVKNFKNKLYDLYSKVAYFYWYPFDENNPNSNQNDRLKNLNKQCLVSKFKCNFDYYNKVILQLNSNQNMFDSLSVHTIMEGFKRMIKSLEIYIKSEYPAQYRFFDPYIYIFNYVGKILDFDYFNSIDNIECNDDSRKSLKSLSKEFLESYKYHFYYIKLISRSNGYNYQENLKKAAIFQPEFLKTIGILYKQYKISHLNIDYDINNIFIQKFNQDISYLGQYNSKECPNNYSTLDGNLIMIYDFLANSRATLDLTSEMIKYCNQIPLYFRKCCDFEVCKSYFDMNIDDDDIERPNKPDRDDRPQTPPGRGDYDPPVEDGIDDEFSQENPEF
ncbi:MAG: hypothetical protein MHPSP_002101, partial [Paramarteilia canceri]